MTDNVLRVGVKVRPSETRVGVKLKDNSVKIAIKVQQSSDGEGRLPAYEGDYTVIPRVNNVVLRTKNKSMLDDVTVFQIPYAEVPNVSGGLTATIGLE